MASANVFPDPKWGCDHLNYPELAQGSINVCLVSVKDLRELARELARLVTDTCWMSNLDSGTRRAYERTVDDTAKILVGILDGVSATSDVAEEFGEIMVSLGSGRALEMIFGHTAIPLAELWKPQTKQNEGFDFHTVCATPLINFGEAKYSGTASPHGRAITQIDGFLGDTKHLRDRIHLQHLCSAESLAHLDADRFGVIAAFSVNGKNPQKVMSNALKSAVTMASTHSIAQVFIVGVMREPH